MPHNPQSISHVSPFFPISVFPYFYSICYTTIMPNKVTYNVWFTNSFKKRLKGASASLLNNVKVWLYALPTATVRNEEIRISDQTGPHAVQFSTQNVQLFKITVISPVILNSSKSKALSERKKSSGYSSNQIKRPDWFSRIRMQTQSLPLQQRVNVK